MHGFFACMVSRLLACLQYHTLGGLMGDRHDAADDRHDAADDRHILHLMAVDVGVINLAIAHGTCRADYTALHVTDIEVLNTMVFEHCRVQEDTCPLHHTGTASDRVAHVVQERQHLFDRAHTIVIERQPPGGLRDVEQVLMTMFRNKSVLVSPRTMHVFIGSNQLEYAGRKRMAIERACVVAPWIVDRFPDKPDDAADAVCLMLTHVHAKRMQHVLHRRTQAARVHAHERGLDFAMYRFEGSARYPLSRDRCKK